MSETRSAAWIVQRRLEGTQGENGVWADMGIVEAATAGEAALIVAEDLGDHMLRTRFRVALAPEWEEFFPRPKHSHSREVVLER